jgi:hypothetical protein
MRRDGLDGREVVTCRSETREATGDGDRLAHNPEVAGSNPAPATKKVALNRPNGRRHQSAAVSFCERCERIGGLGCFPAARIRPAASL